MVTTFTECCGFDVLGFLCGGFSVWCSLATVNKELQSQRRDMAN